MKNEGYGTGQTVTMDESSLKLDFFMRALSVADGRIAGEKSIENLLGVSQFHPSYAFSS